MKPLTIKLSPHDALVLASFHNEFMQDMGNDEQLVSLKTAMNNFLDQVAMNMPEGGIEDAHMEIEVNIALGRSPERPKR